MMSTLLDFYSTTLVHWTNTLSWFSQNNLCSYTLILCTWWRNNFMVFGLTRLQLKSTIEVSPLLHPYFLWKKLTKHINSSLNLATIEDTNCHIKKYHMTFLRSHANVKIKFVIHFLAPIFHNCDHKHKVRDHNPFIINEMDTSENINKTFLLFTLYAKRW